MIKRLHVENFALIDDLDITFQEGLTALTGETGAGKSIILESLYLLFGKRSDQQMIRHGHDQAIVSGLFVMPEKLRVTFDLPKELEIKRSIDQSGRHQIRLNDQIVTLSKLKEVTESLGSIHSQNDTMMLYDKQSYLEFVDQVDQKLITPLLNQYLMARSQYLESVKLLETTKKKKDMSLEKEEFLAYQVKEIEALSLKKGEKEALNESIEKLKNYDKIVSQLRLAYDYLSGDLLSVDHIFESAKALDKIKSLDHAYLEIAERLSSAYYEIDDAKSILFDMLDTLDFDQDAFNQMQERSYELDKIEHKYQKSVEELILYLEEIKNELHMITDYDDYILTLKTKSGAAFEKAHQKGLELTKARQKCAKTLSSEILEELKDLDLDKSQFEVSFEAVEKGAHALFETGLDQIEFYISLNEGEPIKPFAKVASGGERARFMFALKTVYAKKQNLSMLILDEIDIGISGKTAAKVALKMKTLSQTMQLIVITHLPQVAAKADHHYGIYKQKESNRMVTRIKTLNDEDRILMIASMLSDEKLSHFAIEQAKHLLEK